MCPHAEGCGMSALTNLTAPYRLLIGRRVVLRNGGVSACGRVWDVRTNKILQHHTGC